MDNQNLNSTSERIIGIAAIVCAIVLAVLLALLPGASSIAPAQPEPPPRVEWQPVEQPPAQDETLSEATGQEDNPVGDFSYPVGKLLVSGRREAYVSGDMLLEIPRLKLICQVLDGTDPETLNQGVCLFEYAQLPGVANANTSVVAHRDIYGKEFYNIHKITDGDLMYLTYEGKKYTYEYAGTLITDSSDWNPIKVKDFACITLQSCDPIGLAINRIFVNGKLIDTQDIE